MPSSGYTAISFVANEQPTTAKWNLIGSNDSSFNLGTGLEDGVILNRHLATAAVKVANMDFSTTPAFRAYLTAAQTVTTAGGTVALGATTEAYDTTNNLNNTTNIFTAPTTGKYLFTYQVADNSGNVTRMTPILRKNGTTNYTGEQANQSFSTGILVLELALTAGDTIQAMINANPANGTLIAGDANSWWTGRLVG